MKCVFSDLVYDKKKNRLASFSKLGSERIVLPGGYLILGLLSPASWNVMGLKNIHDFLPHQGYAISRKC